MSRYPLADVLVPKGGCPGTNWWMPRYPMADVPVPEGGCPGTHWRMCRYLLADIPVTKGGCPGNQRVMSRYPPADAPVHNGGCPCTHCIGDWTEGGFKRRSGPGSIRQAPAVPPSIRYLYLQIKLMMSVFTKRCHLVTK